MWISYSNGTFKLLISFGLGRRAGFICHDLWCSVVSLHQNMLKKHDDHDDDGESYDDESYDDDGDVDVT